MESNVNYHMVLLGILSIIDATYSAVLLDLNFKSSKEDYSTSRDASVHRGLLLSLSTAQKNQICTDLFSKKLDPIARGFEDLSVLLEGVSRPLTVTDQWKTKDEPEHPIIVKAILAVGAKYTPTNKEEIFFKCYLQNYVGQTSAERSEHYVSSAYHPGLMYDGSEWNEMERNEGISIRKYILLSPEFVSSDQTDLESQYVTTQRTLKYLAEESAEYVKLIEKKDIISTLSVWQTFLLCSSIIFSPRHEDDRHHFTLKWLEYKENAERKLYSKYTNKRLSFKNKDFDSEGWKANCVYCMSSSSDADNLSGSSKNVFLTSDFSDQNSVYVLIEQNETLFITEYMKNVPGLINANVPATDNPPFY